MSVFLFSNPTSFLIHFLIQTFPNLMFQVFFTSP